MLSQEQIEKLEPLTNHPRYGKILQRAMKSWETSTPIYGDFGLKFDKEEFYLTENNSCCLLGAALIGLKRQIIISETLIKEFEISHNEVIDLYKGFDDISEETMSRCSNRILSKEAYEFGNDVRKIVNPKFAGDSITC